MRIPKDLQVGMCFRGKKPKRTPNGYWNDRLVIWLDEQRLVYVSHELPLGGYSDPVLHAEFKEWMNTPVGLTPDLVKHMKLAQHRLSVKQSYDRLLSKVIRKVPKN